MRPLGLKTAYKGIKVRLFSSAAVLSRAYGGEGPAGAIVRI